MTSGPPTPYGPGLCVPNGRIPTVSCSALSNPSRDRDDEIDLPA